EQQEQNRAKVANAAFARSVLWHGRLAHAWHGRPARTGGAARSVEDGIDFEKTLLALNDDFQRRLRRCWKAASPA
ncbi:MAG: hypothetical protein ABFD85_16190, partial [Phycisphaerae bacterium]